MVCCWECKDVVGVGGLGDGDEDPLVNKWGSAWRIWQWVFSYSQDKFLFHVFYVRENALYFHCARFKSFFGAYMCRNWYYVLGFLIVRNRDEYDEWIQVHGLLGPTFAPQKKKIIK